MQCNKKKINSDYAGTVVKRKTTPEEWLDFS